MVARAKSEEERSDDEIERRECVPDNVMAHTATHAVTSQSFEAEGLPYPEQPEPVTHIAIKDDQELINNTTSGKKGVKGFRLKNMMMHITYSYQFDEANFLHHVKRLLMAKDNDVKEYSIVKEFGKRKTETGEAYPHLHAAFKFQKPLLITTDKFFDYKETPEVTDKQKHPHINGIHASKWNYICRVYHTKDGIPYTNVINRGLTQKPPITLDDLSNCKSKSDVAHYLDKRGELEKMTKIEPAWRESIAKRPKGLHRPQKLFLWQSFILSLVSSDTSDDRSIIWIYNPEGQMGKSTLSNIIAEDYNGCVITTTNYNDALHYVRNHTDHNGHPKVIVLDITRSTHISNDVYRIVEGLKSPQTMSGKYDSKCLGFPFIPFVLVFSNSKPDINKLTLDRWIIHVSNFNGQEFDYTFSGLSGRIINEVHRQFELEKQAIAAEHGEEYTPAISKSQEIDVEHFDTVMNMLPREVRITYWEKGLIPIVEIALSPGEESSTKTSIKISEREMTPQEKDDYTTWKKQYKSIDQQIQSEKYKEYRERVIASKKLELEKFKLRYKTE